MLTNPVYVGRVRLRGEERQGVHEPIIDLETWDRTQALLAAQSIPKGKGRGRKPRGQHLFVRGLLRCAECGEAMVPRTQGDSYLCNGRQVHGCQMPWVSRKVIDEAVYAYFEQVALDVEATRRTLAEARDRKLAEVNQLLAEANAEQRRSEERLSRVRRDYQDGRLDVDDWQEQRAELAAELGAAKAETQRLRDQERDVSEWAELVDAEQATLERLTEIRRAIAGELRGSDAIESVRAALAHTFKRFVLHRAASSRAPKRLHVELAMIDGFLIEPVVQEQVIHGYSESMRPVLQREALALNKERQGVGYRLIDG
jgi:site-specific DNA recombinase